MFTKENGLCSQNMIPTILGSNSQHSQEDLHLVAQESSLIGYSYEQ